MKRFIEGQDRSQSTLLPDCIEDYVEADNPVRAVDAFIDMLDLATLGFNVEPEATGRPGYHPATMLKLYLYGYLNQVQSSRRLERECGRNLELIWLTGRLKPDFKTIADFRRDNGPAIRKACRQFVALCRDIDLLDASVVAIDGSKFKAVNAKARSYTREKLKRRLGEIDEAINRYMAELDRADEVLAKTGMAPVEARLSRVVKKLAHYRKEARSLRAVEQRMDATGETQVSLTDPDCRAMATTSKQPRVVGYNVQSVVETKHHLIVAHEVTNLGYDRDALSMMARAAKDVMASESIEAVADKGYYSGEEIVAAEKAGIAVTVSKPNTSNAGAAGRFDKADFVYVAADDIYICPAGERLTYRMTSEHDGKMVRMYWTSACADCPVKHRCTTGKERRVRRWEHETILERVQKRLDDDPSKIPLRSKTVEHPFGTIKAWMGATHFRMKTLKHVATEMALHVLAYNVTRVMAIMGVSKLIEAMRT
ncbi:MAG TPA: IS1182 family transposase [Hyphomicrobiaceae bacterium]|nr:IS1182 family transposase [Hyphomicrobiaceae bacterium]